ncbi:MAG: hypothetical protein QXS21_06445 [Thermoproteota archaeon]|nr:hypothetical protein [Candidatus Brockarchaeota archaeon]MBO3802182.1 hypothetical protein [Candidatus Brockarchaeota archaeon]
MMFDDLKLSMSLLEDGILVVGPACCELAVMLLEKAKEMNLNIVAIDRTGQLTPTNSKLNKLVTIDLNKYRINPLKNFSKDQSYLHRVLTILVYAMGRSEAKFSTSNKVYNYSDSEELSAAALSSEITEDEFDGLEILLREANKNLSARENLDFSKLINKDVIFNLENVKLQDVATLLTLLTLIRVKELWHPKLTLVAINYPELYFRLDKVSTTSKLQVLYEFLDLVNLGFKLMLITLNKENLPPFIKDLVKVVLETKEFLTFNNNIISREFKVNVYSACNEDLFATFSLEGQVVKEFRAKSSCSNYKEYLSKEENLSYVLSLLEQDFGNRANVALELIKLVSKEPIGFNELATKLSVNYGKNASVVINKMIRLRYLTPIETEDGIKIALSEKGKKILSLEGEN